MVLKNTGRQSACHAGMRRTFCRDWARGSGGSGTVGHQGKELKKLQPTREKNYLITQWIHLVFSVIRRHGSFFSVPNVNFAESGPSVSTPVANATCPSADLSYTTPLGSDSAASSNPSVQIPDEYVLPTDLGFWDKLPLLELEDPVEGHHLLPEPHVHQVESEGLLNVFNVDTDVVPPDVSRSSTSSRWQNFVWLIRACHRFSQAAAASLRAKVPEANINVFKGVMEKKGKFVCEMRVKKKIQLEKKKIIKKVWLGTYQTQAQAARALDVGKYFFNAKEKKTFFDPNTETMLSTLSQQLLAQPLDLLVDKVKQIAKYYGNHGTLP